MSASKAHSWARTYHRELADEDRPTVGQYSGPELADVVRRRLAGSGDYAEVTLPVLERTWIEVLDVGYCTAEIRAVEDEFAILIDSGLIRTVQAAARVVAHHFGPAFSRPKRSRSRNGLRWVESTPRSWANISCLVVSPSHFRSCRIAAMPSHATSRRKPWRSWLAMSLPTP